MMVMMRTRRWQLLLRGRNGDRALLQDFVFNFLLEFLRVLSQSLRRLFAGSVIVHFEPKSTLFVFKEESSGRFQGSDRSDNSLCNQTLFALEMGSQVDTAALVNHLAKLDVSMGSSGGQEFK